MPLYTTQGIFVYRGTEVNKQHIVHWCYYHCSFSTGATTTVASSTAGAITNVLQAPLLETQFTLLLSQSALEYLILLLDIMAQLFACFGQRLAPAGKN